VTQDVTDREPEGVFMSAISPFALAVVFPVLMAGIAAPAFAQESTSERQTYGPRLEGFDYPFRTEIFNVPAQGPGA